jgi:hypothetical protein
VKYLLVAVFTLTGQTYVERSGLSLQECAGRAAMLRQETEHIFEHVGDFRYLCIPQINGGKKN